MSISEYRNSPCLRTGITAPPPHDILETNTLETKLNGNYISQRQYDDTEHFKQF